MIKKFVILVMLAFISLNMNVYAEDKKQNAQVTSPDYSAGSEEKYQKIIDDYKQYLTTVSKGVISEVTAFRVEIEKLNQQKQDLYRRLSQESQRHLATEKDFKRKLPRKQRAEISQTGSSK